MRCCDVRIDYLVKALAVHEGYNLTALPDVRILRADRPCQNACVLRPGGVIVCQGSRGYSGQQTYLIYMMSSTTWQFRYQCRL